MTDTKPRFYECGICTQMHSAEWNGDCRQDDARFNIEDLDAKYGQDGWEEIDMPGYETKLVEDLIAGDMVDLEGDIFADADLCPSFECELCIVAGSERETDTCIRVDFEGLNSVGFPPGHRVKIGGFDSEYAAAATTAE